MPAWLNNTLIVLATVVVMEVIAWAVHRFIMHGWGWAWHRSHHEPGPGWFEKNDLYAVVFAVIAVGLIIVGSAGLGPAYWIGMGATLYGALYALVHDGLVHRRWPLRYVPRRGYLKRLYQAHRLHHAVQGRDGCVSFGFLLAWPTATLHRQLKQNIRDGRALPPVRGQGWNPANARGRNSGPAN